MLRFHSAFIVLIVLLSGRVFAQTNTRLQKGVNEQASYGGSEIDSVNLVNGNLMLRIPLFSLPQLGQLKLSFSLVFNSNVYKRGQHCSRDQSGSFFCDEYYYHASDTPGPHLVLDQALTNSYTVPYAPEFVLDAGGEPDLEDMDDVASYETEEEHGTGVEIADDGGGEYYGAQSRHFFASQNIRMSSKKERASAVGKSRATLKRPMVAPANQTSWRMRPIYSLLDSSGAAHPMMWDANDPTLLSTLDGSGIRYQAPAGTSTYDAYHGPAPMGQTSYALAGVITTADGTTQSTPSGYTGSTFQDDYDGESYSSLAPVTVKDLSGNQFTYQLWGYGFSEFSPGQVTDSLQRVIPDFTALPEDQTSAGCKPLGAQYEPFVYSKTWNVPGPNGKSAKYVFCFAGISWHTLLSGEPNGTMTCDGYGDCPESFGGGTGIEEVVLPDGRYYAFHYDSSDAPAGSVTVTPPSTVTFTSDTYGDVNKIVLPTGGTISYSYKTLPTCDPYSKARFIKSRTVDDNNGNISEWSYDYSGTASWNVSAHIPITTRVTDPAGDDTVHRYTAASNQSAYACQGVKETAIERYSGAYISGSSANLVKTTTFSYGLAALIQGPSYGSAAPQPPPILVDNLVTSQTEQVNGGPTVTTSFDYPSLSGVASWECTNGDPNQQPGCQYAHTNLSGYSIPIHYLNPSSTSRVSSDGSINETTTITPLFTVQPAYKQLNVLSVPYRQEADDSSGMLAQTTFHYDYDATTVSSIHGLLTQKDHWVDSTHAITTTSEYYSDGMPWKTKDGNGTESEIVYDTKGLMPKTITKAGFTNTFVYDDVTGKITDQKDPNQIETTYTYEDGSGRLQEVVAAVGTMDESRTSYRYTGPNDTHPNLTQVWKDQRNPGDGLISSMTQQDGLGREIKTVRPDGTSTEKTYDVRGFVRATSLPHTGSAHAWSAASFDTLGRVTFVCNPEAGASPTIACGPQNASLTLAYAGNVQTETDELNHQFVRTYNDNGELLSVKEPGVGTAGSGLLTSYKYDGLGNLICVDQWPNGQGTACGSQRARSFTYDGLSRLVSSYNPETGSICYGKIDNGYCSGWYDGNSNLRFRTDARGVITVYQYNALDQLVSKMYSGADIANTPSSCFEYGSPQPSISLGAGRLLNSWTQHGVCPSTAPASGALTKQSILLVSPLGHILKWSQCIGGSCSTGGAPPFQMTQAFDRAGSRTMWTDGSGQLIFWQESDTSGRPTSVRSSWNDLTHPVDLFTAKSFHESGALQSWQQGPHIKIDRDFDATTQRIISQTAVQQ